MHGGCLQLSCTFDLSGLALGLEVEGEGDVAWQWFGCCCGVVEP